MEYSVYLYCFFLGRATIQLGLEAAGAQLPVSGVSFRCPGSAGLGSPGRRSSSGAARGVARPGPWLTCRCSENCSVPLLLR